MFLITAFSDNSIFKSTYQFIPKLIYFSTQSGTMVNDLNSSPATQLPGIPLSTLYALNKLQTLHYMQNLCSFLLQLECIALQRNILNNQLDVTTDSWLQLNSQFYSTNLFAWPPESMAFSPTLCNCAKPSLFCTTLFLPILYCHHFHFKSTTGTV